MDLYKDKTANIKDRVEDLLSKMTLEEKIGQTVQMPLSRMDFGKVKQLVRDGQIGAFIFALTSLASEETDQKFAIDKANEVQRIAVEESRLGIPIINGRDIIHGNRTIFPTPLAQAASWDESLVEKASEIMAREAACTGVHWTFAPMVDLSRDPRWSRISESFGEDPYLAGELARASVHGIQGDDMSKPGKLLACAKHYIGYGAAEGGRDYCKSEISEYTMRNFYLNSFKQAVKAGVGTVMNSFNEISGQPVASSKYLLRDVLRDELGFNGYVISDWGSVEQLENFGVANNRKECAELAFNAGVDMDMCSDCYIEHLKDLIEEGKVSMETLDATVRNILTMKFKVGLFEHPYIEVANPEKEFLLPDALALSEKFVAESAVLLKNNGVLPLKKGTSIALTGDMIEAKRDLISSWSADGRAEDTQSFIEALCEYNGEENCDTSRNISGVYAQSIFTRNDVIIVAIGEPWMVTGEANCIASIDVTDQRLEYVRRAKMSGKKVITVIFAAKPLAITDVEQYSDAVLYAWQGGTRTAMATVKLLFGEYVPCGKMPCTMPRHTGQIPIYYNFNENPRFIDDYYNNKDKFMIGKRTLTSYHDICGAPLHPFGYGLSYTEFEYSEAKADKYELTLEEINDGASFTITTTVKNIGSFDANEIAQCYIADIKASMCRPTRELRGFKKKFIQQGETVTIEFKLGYEELGFYRADNKFAVEKGEFEVYVGKDCLTENKLIIKVI